MNNKLSFISASIVMALSSGAFAGGNSITLIQNNTDASPDNFESADIVQIGGILTIDSNQSGFGDQIDIYQSGRSGTITTLQEGSGNAMALDQVGLVGNEIYAVQKGVANTLAIRQGVRPNGEAAVATGDQNVIKTEQTGDGNQIDASQSGTSDTSTSIVQRGNDHESSVTQTNGISSRAIVNQLGGDNNTALIDQADGVLSFAAVSQEGNDNSHSIRQTGDNHDATIIVLGDRNSNHFDSDGEAAITQEGADSVAAMTVVGNDNSTSVFQLGTSSADINVRGNDNRNLVETIFDSGSVATSFQTGDTNDSTIFQLGGGENSALINQTGNLNVSNLYRKTFLIHKPVAYLREVDHCLYSLHLLV